jgi:DNA-binding XRE family transcriptional regulator
MPAVRPAARAGPPVRGVSVKCQNAGAWCARAVPRASLARARSDLQRTLARNLLARRTAKGLTQQALADLAGISNRYVSAIERGQRRPPMRTAKRIAKALGTTLTTLMVGDAPAVPPTT